MYRNKLIVFSFVTFSLFGGIGFRYMNAALANDKSKIELATVCVDELCGYVNNKGEWHIQPKFVAADPFSKEGLAWVITYDGVTDGAIYIGDTYKGADANQHTRTPYGGRFGLINSQGDFVIPPQYFGQIKPFSKDGLAAAEANGLWGFINRNGQWLIEPQFNRVGDFSANGLAPAEINSLWGYINASGQWVITPQFHSAYSFDKNGLAMVFTSDGRGGIRSHGDINVFGQLVTKPQSDNGLIEAGKDKKRGFINAQGQWIIEPRFDETKPFSNNNLAAAKIDSNWGFINPEGQWAVEPKFTEVKPFSKNSLAAVKISGKWGYINASGQWVIEPKYDYAGSFGYYGHNDVAEVGTDPQSSFQNGRHVGRSFGFINSQGQPVSRPTDFVEIENFSSNGLAAAKKNGKWGFINADEQWVIEPKFDSVGSFGDNELAPARINHSYGYINAKGEWIIRPKFDSVGHFAKNGLAVVEIGGNKGYINTKGEWVIELQFQMANNFSDNGLAAAKKSDKYGFINDKGQWAIEPQFDNYWSFSPNGLATVIVNGYRGIINTEGLWIVEPKYSDVGWSGNIGDLAGVAAKAPWAGIGSISKYIDVNSGAYRTGLNKKNDEAGFRWERAKGIKTLLNHRQEKILTLEVMCGTEVAKNAAGKIIGPQKNSSWVCPESKTK